MPIAVERFQFRHLALALQDAQGTPAMPDPTADAVRLIGGQAGTEFDTVDNPVDRPYFSGTAFATYNHRAFVSGHVNLQPPASPGRAVVGLPDVHPLLLIAGMTPVLDEDDGTTRYQPVSVDIPCATADFWHAGTFRRLYDARANLSALALAIGSRAVAQLLILGWYDNIDEATLPATSAANEDAPVLGAATAQAVAAGHRVWAKSLTVNLHTRLAAKHFTAHREIGYDDRKPTFTMRLAKTALADIDPWALRKAGTIVSLSLRNTRDDGRYIEIGVRGLIRDIDEREIDADYGWEISGPCIASSAGGDEFYLQFGSASTGTPLPTADSTLIMADSTLISADAT